LADRSSCTATARQAGCSTLSLGLFDHRASWRCAANFSATTSSPDRRDRAGRRPVNHDVPR
jgi:hypothetical protein